MVQDSFLMFGLVESELVVYVVWKIVLILLMLFMNSIMLNFLVHAMNGFGSTIATTIVTSFSFCMSGIIGLAFGEVVNLQWWLGVAVILTGVVFVGMGANEDEIDQKKVKVI